MIDRRKDFQLLYVLRLLLAVLPPLLLLLFLPRLLLQREYKKPELLVTLFVNYIQLLSYC